MKGTVLGHLFLLLLASPAAVQAQFVYTNADGSIYDYSINADGSANITYYTGPPWAVTVPTNINNLTVTSIGSGGEGFAFYGPVTSVTIPASVTSIGDFVFDDRTSLTTITVDTNNPAYSSVNGVLFDITQSTLVAFPGGVGGSYTIPDSVTNIEAGAFANCPSLTNVTISDGVTSIGESTFIQCYNLTSVTIPDSVTVIGDAAFFSCSSLTNVTIPASVISIGDDAFEDCSSLTLTSVAIPNGVTNIGNVAFAATSLTSITIPGGITSIGGGMFASCSHLTNITILGSVTNIGELAFYDCNSLTSVYFTGNAPPVGAEVFTDDPATVYYLPGTTGWSNTFASSPSVPAVLWNPLMQASGANFGVQNKQFGFNITGTNNYTVVVEACTNLANAVWTPLTNVTLINGTFYFSDPQWTNYPNRFYGLGLP